MTKIAEEKKLGRRLVRGHPMLEAEVVYAAQHEYCETAEDFIARRTRLAFLDVEACRQALPRVRQAPSTQPVFLLVNCGTLRPDAGAEPYQRSQSLRMSRKGISKKRSFRVPVIMAS